MAEIDSRVRGLVSTLMASGFAWLANEIVEVIEAGRRDGSELDTDVKQQRTTINSSDARELRRTQYSAERIFSATIREESTATPFSGDEQVKLAVEIIRRRLVSATDMLNASGNALSRIMDRPVRMQVIADGDARDHNTSGIIEARSRLEKLSDELTGWLLSQNPTESP